MGRIYWSVIKLREVNCSGVCFFESTAAQFTGLIFERFVVVIKHRVAAFKNETYFAFEAIN